MIFWRIIFVIFLSMTAEWGYSETAKNAGSRGSSRSSSQQDSILKKIVFSAKLSIASSFVRCEFGDAVLTSLPKRQAKITGAAKTSSNQCEPQKIGYSQRTGRMKLIDGTIDPVPGNATDCSGFISGVLCRAGARLNPGSDDCGPVNTEQMIKWGTGNDCFEVFDIQPSEQLRPGCFVVWRNEKTGYGHTMLIQQIGEDPLGIHSVQDCTRGPDLKAWDFIEAESMLYTGPAQIKAATRYATSKMDRPALDIFYKGICHAVKKEKTIPAQWTQGNWNVKILCHVGEKNPECFSKASRKFKNESCVAKCMNR